jgi:acetyltransferase-like isoleucine patch superfamily enzyme
MPGVVLEEGSVVLPGSVVTKSFNKFGIVGGNPAQLIAQRKDSVDYKIENKFYFSL